MVRFQFLVLCVLISSGLDISSGEITYTGQTCKGGNDCNKGCKKGEIERCVEYRICACVSPQKFGEACFGRQDCIKKPSPNCTDSTRGTGSLFCYDANYEFAQQGKCVCACNSNEDCKRLNCKHHLCNQRDFGCFCKQGHAFTHGRAIVE